MALLARWFPKRQTLPAAEPARIEPVFQRANDNVDTINENGIWWSSPSATGIQVNQQTALQVTAVMACVSIVSEDIAKLTPQIWKIASDGSRIEAAKHALYRLLKRPNEWQTWFEFCQMMVAALMMRGNAYAVILRNGRDDPYMLVPINPDRVTLWEAPNGELYWVVTRSGLHEMYVLRQTPLFVPYRDVMHWKGLSGNGLLGASKIALNREAIGLASGLEQLAAHTIGNGAFVRGTLESDKKVPQPVIDRLKMQWAQQQAGIINGGKPLILEDGLKWKAFTLSFADLQYIASRNFQVAEIARMWRVPLAMLGEIIKGGQNHLTEQSQDYLNSCLMSYVEIIEQRFQFTFELYDDISVLLDLSKVLRGDLAARYAAYRIGLMSMVLTPNEMRRTEGLPPSEHGDADKLWRPNNLVPIDSDVAVGLDLPGLGSDQTGTGAPGGGRPPDDGGDAAPAD